MDGLHLTLLSLGALALIYTVWADLVRRTVRLIPLLVLAVCGLVFQGQGGMPGWGWQVGINAAVVTAVLGLAWLGLLLTGRKGFLHKQIGLGDVLFFYAMATWLPGLVYALYFTTGLMLTLMGVLILMLMNRYPRELPLPLAGSLAAYALLVLPAYFIYATEVMAYLNEIS